MPEQAATEEEIMIEAGAETSLDIPGLTTPSIEDAKEALSQVAETKVANRMDELHLQNEEQQERLSERQAQESGFEQPEEAPATESGGAWEPEESLAVQARNLGLTEEDIESVGSDDALELFVRKAADSYFQGPVQPSPAQVAADQQQATAQQRATEQAAADTQVNVDPFKFEMQDIEPEWAANLDKYEKHNVERITTLGNQNAQNSRAVSMLGEIAFDMKLASAISMQPEETRNRIGAFFHDQLPPGSKEHTKFQSFRNDIGTLMQGLPDQNFFKAFGLAMIRNFPRSASRDDSAANEKANRRADRSISRAVSRKTRAPTAKVDVERSATEALQRAMGGDRSHPSLKKR